MSDGFRLLTEASGEMDAKIIESKLKFYGIEVILEHVGMGSFYSIIGGYSRYGVNVFVSENDYDTAYAVIFNEDKKNEE